MSGARNPHSLACKKIFRVGIARAGMAQKVVAADIDTHESQLSRYLSDESDQSMPVDKMLLFVASTGDKAIIKYQVEQAGGHFVDDEESLLEAARALDIKITLIHSQERAS